MDVWVLSSIFDENSERDLKILNPVLTIILRSISANCLRAPTDAGPKYSSGARDTSPCSTACLRAQNAGHIAQPCRRGRSLRTVCGDSDPCAVFELNHLEPAFFPHPCAETPTRAETLTRAETRILTVVRRECAEFSVLCSDASALRLLVNGTESRSQDGHIHEIRQRTPHIARARGSSSKIQDRKAAPGTSPET